MGSPLGSVLANIFMCDFEEKWLMNAKISPLFLNWRIDGMFTMLHNKDSAHELLHYLNSCHSNIKFSIEYEQENAIPFLDILSHAIKITKKTIPQPFERLSLAFTPNSKRQK